MKFNTLIEAVAHWAEHTPDKVCLIDADIDRKMTYGEFWLAIRAFARRLQDVGLKKGDRVVVRVGALLETFVAQYSVWLVGGVYCPVEKHMKTPALIEMLDYFDSTLLISSKQIDYGGKWIDLSSVGDSNEVLEGLDFPNHFPDSEDICAIAFTTGTTGKAKGIMISHNVCAISAQLRCEAYAINDSDIYYWVTPMERASCLRHFGAVLSAGCTAVHFSGVVFVDNYLQNIKKYGVTFIYLQSYALNIVLNARENAFDELKNQIRLMYFGGGSMPEKLKHHLCASLPTTQLFVAYSSTEATTISYYEFSRYPGKANCVGKPFPGNQISFMDENGTLMKEASKDHPGIIVYEGLCGMSGYWRDEELTARTKQDGRIVMTDMGYTDEDGFIYLAGRRDDVIVSGGNKIAPYEIEDIVLQMPGVAECVCVSAPHEAMAAVPKLFVVMKKHAEFSAKEIYDFLAARMEAFKLPRIIREIEKFPVIAGSTKIDRRALLEYE